jgi:hypothetical protein
VTQRFGCLREIQRYLRLTIQKIWQRYRSPGSNLLDLKKLTERESM